MNIKKDIVLRVRLAFLAVFLFALAIVFRVFYLQTVQGDYWRAVQQQRNVQYRVVPATRGNIYSDNGSLLATSIPYYRLAIDPTACRADSFQAGISGLSIKLAAFFKDHDANFYRQRLEQGRRAGKQYVSLSSRLVTHQERKWLQTLPILRLGRYKGGTLFEKFDRRVLPFTYLGRRTVGTTDYESGRGTLGLEYSFNPQLGGRNGEALYEKIAGGWMPVNNGSEIKPEPGLDIQTTIDINIQDVAETSLLANLRMHQAAYGCVVVMEVATGEIKALANLGRLADGNYAEKFNYAVSLATDPGSTFKLPTLIALLEESNNALSLHDSIQTGEGYFRYHNAEMRDTKAHGTLTVQQAFEKSSNVAFVKMTLDQFKDKPQRYLDYLRSFGLTQPLGFQLRGEGKPYFKDPTDPTWSKTTLPWMSVGYESRITPLHMLTLYNAVANHGRMVQPILVKEVRMADEVVERFAPTVLNEKICSDATLKKVRQALEGVVERGTAQNIKNPDYKIAGKTGTSQKIRDGRYTKSYYTSFIGFFPAQLPKYSCAVVIDSPQGLMQYGADVAAPVFKDIADKVYARDIQMHKLLPARQLADAPGQLPRLRAGQVEDLRLICNALGVSNHARDDQEWVEAQPKANAVVWRTRANHEGLVPDVAGLTLRDALFVLENKGLRVTHVGYGRVVSQSRSPGERIIRGNAIALRAEP